MVMAEVVEFEFLKRRHHLFAVMPFIKYAKRENKYRIVRVNVLQAMVAAFIDINNEITESSFWEGA